MEKFKLFLSGKGDGGGGSGGGRGCVCLKSGKKKTKERVSYFLLSFLIITNDVI